MFGGLRFEGEEELDVSKRKLGGWIRGAVCSQVDWGQVLGRLTHTSSSHLL